MCNNIKFLSLKELDSKKEKDTRKHLLRLYKDSRDGWLYHSLKWLEFINCYEKTSSAGFLIKYSENNEIQGFLPLSIFENDEIKSISLNGEGIGWPIISNSVNESVEDQLLGALKKYAEKNYCDEIKISLRNPLVNQKDLIKRQKKVTSLEYKTSIQSNHFFDNWEQKIRKRYSRYVRKYLDKFKISIIDSRQELDVQKLAEEYMKLHISDSGKKTRNLESYIKQVEFIKEDEAFFVKAENNITGITEGMLLVTLIKNHGLDNSVATTEDGRLNYVSHVLKHVALNKLDKLNTKSYILGIDYTIASELSKPSEKQIGISYFKDGWCGGERFYSLTSILNLKK